MKDIKDQIIEDEGLEIEGRREFVPDATRNEDGKDRTRGFGREKQVEKDEYHPQDDLLTPPYCLDAMAPLVKEFPIIWEPFASPQLPLLEDWESYSVGLSGLNNGGHVIVETGLEKPFDGVGSGDFFTLIEDETFMGYLHRLETPPLVMSNIPWSKKQKIITALVKADLPFSLIVPSAMYPLVFIYDLNERLLKNTNEDGSPNPLEPVKMGSMLSRVSYKTPTKAWSGDSQLPSGWLSRYVDPNPQLFFHYDLRPQQKAWNKMLRQKGLK